MITANSYIIHQTDSLIENSKIIDKQKNKFKDIINFGINLLTGFLTIKQIGFVSANDDGLWCCEILESNDATCQPISAGDDSLCDSSGQTWYTDCELTSLCKTGTCIDEEYGTCSPGTKKECGDNWDPLLMNEISECQLGCCSLNEGTRKEWWTDLKCNNEGGSFDNNIPQSECKVLTEEMGACVLGNNDCRFTTEEDCEVNLNGEPHPGLLCSNPDLGTNCGGPETTGEIQTTCYNDKVYFLDNCSNIANIYDADKWDVDDYWKFVQEPICDAIDNPATCGNCDGTISICASSFEAGINPEYGNYACKDLSCKDDDFFSKHGRNPLNQESWCVYESHVGESRDVVGSEHRARWCDKGKIKYKVCGNYRGKICGEKQIPLEEGGSVSMARCRFNEGWKGFLIDMVPYEFDEDTGDITNQEDVDKYKAECGNLSDSRIQSINVDDYFKFNVCVPKYPKGFKFWNSESNDEDVCRIASTTCIYVYEKRLNAENDCKRACKEEYREEHDGNCPKSCRVACRKKCRKWPLANEDCTTKEFAEEMNDFCISLGDCGGYVNVQERYTKNFRVSESGYREDLDADKINQYKSYAADEQIGLGDPPLFFSSAEKGFFEGDPLAGIEVGGIKDIQKVIQIVLGTTAVIAVLFKVGLILFAAPEGLFSKIGGAIAMALAAILGFFTWLLEALGIRETVEVDIKFTCKPWQAPPGGDDCDECNNDPLRPCTEYKCRSLGTACRLIDEDELYESEIPVCINKYPNDVTPPQIVFEKIDTSLYNVDDRPGGNGVRIRTSGGDCIQEFTSINFSLKTKDENENDDYAKCVYNWESVSLNPPDYVLDGEYFKEGNYYSINHTFIERLPFVSSLDDISGNLGEREGELNMYVRCMDYAGNFNFNEYIVNFCIREGPDNTIATIKEFIPADKSFLAYGKTTKTLIISLDEPADCKWSYGTDKSYENMENFIYCEDYTGEIKPSWSCTTELTGLTQLVNNIYIKCKDQSWISEENYTGPWSEENRNVNTPGFLYTLYGTENPLNITSISPQGNIEIGGSVSEIFLEVTTSGGMDNGISTCRYWFVESPSGITSGDFFSQIDSYHTYPLSPPTGNYNIAIECKDEAENKATGNAIFNLIKDLNFSKAVRVYKSGSNLKLITDEQASCYYSFKSCNFDFDDENINSMTTAYSTEHTANWNTGQKYYIRCEDLWGNSGCSIIVSLA